MTTKQYFYRPLAYYGGKVLKCAGICTDSNREWFTADCQKPDGIYQAGVVILDGYKGDRISAADHSEFKG